MNLFTLVLLVLAFTMDIQSTSNNKAVYNAAFSPDSLHVVTVSADTTAVIWDVETCQLLHRLEAHMDEVYRAVYSPNGEFVATGGRDRTVVIWEASRGNLHHILRGHAATISGLTFSSDQSTLVTADVDGRIIHWDVATGELVENWQLDVNEIIKTVLSPDGQYVAAIINQSISIWDTTSRQLVSTIHAPALILSATFTFDSQYIATTGYEMPIARIWDVKTGDEISSVGSGAADSVTNISFSHNGQMLAANSNSNPINRDYETKVYDVSSGKRLFVLRENSEAVVSATFSPTDELLVTGYYDGTASMWNVNTHDKVCNLDA